MRAFIALDLPEVAKKQVTTLQGDLARSDADVKWVLPAQLHLTLRFLGDINDEQRAAVTRILTDVAVQHGPITLQLDRVGAFPSLEAPRVVWVGLAQGGEVAAHLACALNEGLARQGFPREEQPFSPHVTVGRVRSAWRRRQLVGQLQTLRWDPPEAWTARTVTFYESMLSSAGPRYAVLADVPFGTASA